MRKRNYNLLVEILICVLVFCSCVHEDIGRGDDTAGKVNVSFSTRGFVDPASGMRIEKLRVIAFNSAGSLEFNKTDSDMSTAGGGVYTMLIRPGVYTLYVIGNEQADMSAALEKVAKEPDVDLVQVKDVKLTAAENLPLYWKKTVFVREKAKSSTLGQVSLNETNWVDRLDILMERLASKIDVSIRKVNINEEVLLHELAIVPLPRFSYLGAKAFPVDGATNANVYQHPGGKNITGEKDQYTAICTDLILPEYLPANAGRRTKLELSFSRNGVADKATIYMEQMDRNKHYQYQISITPVSVEIQAIQVLPWSEVETDQSTDGVEFNISDVEVPYSYGQESRVYFTMKNIHPDNVSLSNGVYSDIGDQIGSLSTYFDRNTKITYNNYDPNTRVGSGYITVRRKIPSSKRLGLLIFAARLKKIIYVKSVDIAGSNIYWDSSVKQLAFDNTPTGGMSAPHEAYQGVYIPYGGLECYPGGAEGPQQAISPLWSAIGDYRKLSTSYTKTVLNAAGKGIIPFDPNNGIGDICVYMSRRGISPDKKKWRLPYLSEFQDFGVRQRESKPNDQLLKADGTGFIYNGMRVDNNIFFPYSGVGWFLASTRGGAFKPYAQSEAYLATQESGVSISASEVSAFSVGANKVFRPFYAFTTRCVADDTPGALAPLYVLSYDLTDAGIVNIPTPEGIMKSVHVDAGGSLTLSNTELLSNKGLHIGWVIDGQIYPFGATISNIHRDMVVTPYIEQLLFADSNIYWDGSKLTFDYSESGSGQAATQQQGVFFKFGSLLAIGADGVVISNPLLLPKNVPFIKKMPTNNINYNLLVNKHDPAKNLGDICKYLSDNGMVPPGDWMMPTAIQMMYLAKKAKKKGPWIGLNTIQQDGRALVNSGYSFLDKYFLPASGFLSYTNYRLSEMGNGGYYWTSSPASSLPYILAVQEIKVRETKAEGFALPVRCVKK
ncbi:MAG: hypothetical protein ACRDD6_07315 [Tannerellaceae bacterium]